MYVSSIVQNFDELKNILLRKIQNAICQWSSSTTGLNKQILTGRRVVNYKEI